MFKHEYFRGKKRTRGRKRSKSLLLLIGWSFVVFKVLIVEQQEDKRKDTSSRALPKIVPLGLRSVLKSVYNYDNKRASEARVKLSKIFF